MELQNISKLSVSGLSDVLRENGLDENLIKAVEGKCFRTCAGREDMDFISETLQVSLLLSQ